MCCSPCLPRVQNVTEYNLKTISRCDAGRYREPDPLVALSAELSWTLEPAACGLALQYGLQQASCTMHLRSEALVAPWLVDHQSEQPAEELRQPGQHGTLHLARLGVDGAFALATLGRDRISHRL